MSRRLLCCTGSLDGGGSERQLVQFATHLDPNRYQAQIYLHHKRGAFLERVPAAIPVHAFWSDIDPHRTFLPGRIHALQVSHLKNVIQREKIDVVYDRTCHMTLVTSAASQATKTPRVSVIVSPPSQDFERSHERFRWFKRRRLSRAYADRDSLVIAVSEAVAVDAASYYGLDRERIRVVSSPVDIDFIEVMAAEPISQDESSCELRIVVVGRLSAEKGQRLAIGAVAQARQLRPEVRIQLDLIGDGPLRAELEGYVNELELQSQIRFLGFQKNPYPWIARADLLCIPSEYEGLPNVALEALALKTPVLATNCSSALTSLLGSNGERGFLVPVNDVAGLAKQFLQRFEPDDGREPRSLRGVAWVREHHSLEASMLKMHAALDDSFRLRCMGRQ